MPSYAYLKRMVVPRGVSFQTGALTMEKARLWIKPVSIYAASAAVVFVFLTEWRVIMDYVPIYRSKWKEG